MKSLKIAFFAAFIAITGCATHDARILGADNQVELRNMQTRAFDTSDKTVVVRNVISTLQDLSFVIDKADTDLGTVSATRLVNGSRVRMTVTARPSSSGKSTIVRANAQYNLKPIENPKIYQDFFSSLSKSLFLSANAVE
ncbi:hypothetical protein I3249_12830 [Psychrobacter sp. Ps1]|uniref:hypothetical protein n=1 Tax=Psychrobacter sp. Ps1 TaxID=2790955 RepID=UPI001EDCDD4C|nr:hypothetical protein [Psychrobacter sp. Ps1]MCG3843652.1 hypothetical protein [Psychrobacter sp. Ps1]